LNDPFELPSLKDIEQMEKQRLQAIESLEIFDHSVKCQRCGTAVPIVGTLPRLHNEFAKANKADGKLLLAMLMISMEKEACFNLK
jgi:hypothetical protein